MGRIEASGKPQRRVSERHLEHTLMELDRHMAASVADTVTGYHTDYVAPLYPAVKQLVRRLSKRHYRRVQALEARIAELERERRPWWRRLLGRTR